MSKMNELAELGQSIWFDYIRRSLITSGELKDLVAQGLRGVTSNPSIFEKAIAGSADYDSDLEQLIDSNKTIHEIYESLALVDIAMAAEQLKPVYESTQGRDGFVSLEVNPDLANNTPKTIMEAKRLFESLNRPNVMIKVPATPAGLPAIAELITSGVNVNVTLIFGLDNYQAVAEAYLSGLEKLAQTGPSVTGGHMVDRVASVASFFVSRVDTAVDQALEKTGNTELQGKIAVANSKIVYEEYRKIFSGSRWDSLATKGARVQRVLWASTSTKNPSYPQNLYVDELIGPNTVNTLPPATLKSFMEHGVVSETLTKGVAEARKQIEQLADLGIDLDKITQDLQDEGVAAFAKSFESLITCISEKRERLLTEKTSHATDVSK
ncbi:MAG: transaldolase [Deltaproteobacteria bacterium]|nr:MAG: transaldolase [Deltaproteobacteria bacterium]